MTTLPQTPKRAVLYARVSTDEQAEKGYSISDQLRSLREHVAREGYNVVDEIVDDGYSGATPNRPGLLTIMELAEAGAIDVVLATKRDRFFRGRLYRLTWDQDMADLGVELLALNDTGNRFGDAIQDEFAEWEREQITERTRNGKLEKTRQGKVLPSRQPHMGFIYHDGSYEVDESRMAQVRRMFRMVGVEGKSLQDVKRAFERDGVTTQRNAKWWDATVIRRMIDNDVYLSRPYEDVAALVDPEVAAKLDPEACYGIYWRNRERTKKSRDGRYVREHLDRSEWIAVPVPDPDIPSEWVEAARRRVKNNVRSPDAERRFWELKGLVSCPCGRRLTTLTPRKKGKNKIYFGYYYICNFTRRHGSEACEHACYHNAKEIEGRIRRLILDLIRDPEVMMRHVRQDIEREQERLERADRERAVWTNELVNVERKRDALIEMRAEGDITKDEFRQKAAGLDARKSAAERELASLEDADTSLKDLEALPSLIEDYLRELPQMIDEMPRIREYMLSDEHKAQLERDRHNGHSPQPHAVVPGTYRKRTPEEIEELRQEDERERARRYRALYELLDLKVVAFKDKTLEVTGTFGIDKITLGPDEPLFKGPKIAPPPPDDPCWDEEASRPYLRTSRRTPCLRQGRTRTIESLALEGNLGVALDHPVTESQSSRLRYLGLMYP
jgi:site-specific DNA recombinase